MKVRKKKKDKKKIQIISRPLYCKMRVQMKHYYYYYHMALMFNVTRKKVNKIVQSET